MSTQREVLLTLLSTIVVLPVIIIGIYLGGFWNTDKPLGYLWIISFICCVLLIPFNYMVISLWHKSKHK